MRSKKLLALIGSVGIAGAAFAHLQPPERPLRPPATPLVDADGRAAPGNVVSKGDPRPKPRDGGTP